MIRYSKDRIEQFDALKIRYLRNEISETAFSASLPGVGILTAEDIRMTMNDHAPAPKRPDFEEQRLEASRQWITARRAALQTGGGE